MHADGKSTLASVSKWNSGKVNSVNCVQLAAVVANNEVKSRRNQVKLIFQVLFIAIFSIFFSLNYSKNVAIVSRSFIFSTFGIQTLSHFIKCLCGIKNKKNNNNKTWRSTTCIFTLIERNFKLLWFYFTVLTECPVRNLLKVYSRFQLGWTFKV